MIFERKFLAKHLWIILCFVSIFQVASEGGTDKDSTAKDHVFNSIFLSSSHRGVFPLHRVVGWMNLTNFSTVKLFAIIFRIVRSIFICHWF